MIYWTSPITTALDKDDVETLKNISRDLGKPCSKPKNELVDHTASEFRFAGHQQEFAPGTITDQ